MRGCVGRVVVENVVQELGPHALGLRIVFEAGAGKEWEGCMMIMMQVLGSWEERANLQMELLYQTAALDRNVIRLIRSPFS